MTIQIKPLDVADPFGFARKKVADEKIHPKSQYTVKSWDMAKRISFGVLKINSHGGGCCGAKHLVNFPHYDVMWEVFLKERIDQFLIATPGQTIEAILAGEQGLQADYAWPKALIKLGFRLVSTNTNSNSSLVNYVFHLCTRPVDSANSNVKAILSLTKEECIANDPTV